jgi:hypothetical protein
MLEIGRMYNAGETDAAESARESASHFAAWAIVSAPLVRVMLAVVVGLGVQVKVLTDTRHFVA